MQLDDDRTAEVLSSNAIDALRSAPISIKCSVLPQRVSQTNRQRSTLASDWLHFFHEMVPQHKFEWLRPKLFRSRLSLLDQPDRYQTLERNNISAVLTENTEKNQSPKGTLKQARVEDMYVGCTSSTDDSDTTIIGDQGWKWNRERDEAQKHDGRRLQLDPCKS